MAHRTDVIPVEVNLEPDNPKQICTDPVCGMKVERVHSRFMAFRGGETYYFCSRECREKFAPSK